MEAFLILAFSLAQPATAQADVVEAAFRPYAGRQLANRQPSFEALIGELPLSIAIGCAEGRRPGLQVYIFFRRVIGYDVAGSTSGGFRLNATFDEGRSGGWRVSAAGEMALAGPDVGKRFVQRLRGTRSLTLRISRQGGGEQVVTYRYPDPAEVIDAAARRCNVNLDD